MRPSVAVALVFVTSATAADERFPLLTDEKTWPLLPKPEAAAARPLPTWARTTARTLPRSTAIILELDELHRTKNPVDARARFMARWVVADALRCEASKTLALADLKAAGATPAEIEALTGSRPGLPAETQRLLSIARQLTVAAWKITDEEMAAVRADLGDPKLVAFVQFVGFANFQDRLILSLGLGDEPTVATPDGLRFKRPWEGGEVPKRPALKESAADPKPPTVADADWRTFDYAKLQKEMAAQKAREPRVSVPTFEDVKRFLPKDAKPVRIKWSLVCMGHSPVLAGPWGGMLRMFAEESKQDRVFEELLFWVITRESQCFY